LLRNEEGKRNSSLKSGEESPRKGGGRDISAGRKNTIGQIKRKKE